MFLLVVQIDPNYTENDFAPAIAFNSAAKSITLAQDTTIQQLYNSLKSLLSEYENLHVANFLTVTENKIHLGDWKLIVNGALTATDKFTEIESTDTITLGEDGSQQISPSRIKME